MLFVELPAEYCQYLSAKVDYLLYDCLVRCCGMPVDEGEGPVDGTTGAQSTQESGEGKPVLTKQPLKGSRQNLPDTSPEEVNKHHRSRFGTVLEVQPADRRRMSKKGTR